MEDMESATIVLSTLINQKIKNLKLEPITHAEKRPNLTQAEIQDPKTKEDISLFHLDFTATVELPDGTDEDYVGDEYKEKLYSLLKLFDQKSKVKGNEHRLRFIRRFFPGFLDRVIRRLQAASINNQELEEQMQIEDDYLKILIKRDNTISALEMKLEQVISEKEQVIESKNKVIYEVAKTLKDLGLPFETINEKTGLDINTIEKL